MNYFKAHLFDPIVLHKKMQKGDIAAVQRDPKDKTLRLRTAGNQSNESDGRFAPILGRDAPRSRRSGGCSSAG